MFLQRRACAVRDSYPAFIQWESTHPPCITGAVVQADGVVVCIASVYLARCDGASVQQGQQTAEGGGADSSGSAARTPHQVRKQDVAQELLRLHAEMPGRRRVSKKRDTGGAEKDILGVLGKLLTLVCSYELATAPIFGCWECSCKAIAKILRFSHNCSEQEVRRPKSVCPFLLIRSFFHAGLGPLTSFHTTPRSELPNSISSGSSLGPPADQLVSQQTCHHI